MAQARTQEAGAPPRGVIAATMAPREAEAPMRGVKGKAMMKAYSFGPYPSSRSVQSPHHSTWPRPLEPTATSFIAPPVRILNKITASRHSSL